MKFLTGMVPVWSAILDVVIAGLAWYWIGWRDGRMATARLAAKKAECEHNSQIVAAQHETLADGPFGSGGKVTIVLARCYTCKAIEAKRLPGTWTLDQLKGENPSAVADSLIAASKGKP